jgi:hypothetical protein
MKNTAPSIRKMKSMAFPPTYEESLEGPLVSCYQDWGRGNKDLIKVRTGATLKELRAAFLVGASLLAMTVVHSKLVLPVSQLSQASRIVAPPFPQVVLLD